MQNWMFSKLPLASDPSLQSQIQEDCCGKINGSLNQHRLSLCSNVSGQFGAKLDAQGRSTGSTGMTQ